jgi:glycerophosphoryl diester phosphodiesterase
MHDKTLDRTTTGSGMVSEADYEALKDVLLIDNEGDTTGYRIPTLKEALEWGRDQVLFTLDVKRGVPFDKVMAMVAAHDATDYAAIITYRIDDAKLIYETSILAAENVMGGFVNKAINKTSNSIFISKNNESLFN